MDEIYYLKVIIKNRMVISLLLHRQSTTNGIDKVKNNGNKSIKGCTPGRGLQRTEQ